MKINAGLLVSQKDREGLLKALDRLRADVANAEFIRLVEFDIDMGMVELDPGEDGYKRFARDGRVSMRLNIDYQMSAEQTTQTPTIAGEAQKL